MDRFENVRDATLAKYRMMRPKGKLSDGLNMAVDGIATLCMGESFPSASAAAAGLNTIWPGNTHVCLVDQQHMPFQSQSCCCASCQSQCWFMGLTHDCT